jgi:hypothetical protein
MRGMLMTRELNAYIFFSDKLNLYSDRGNAIILRERSERRGIKFNLIEVDGNELIDFKKADIFLIGGGSDREQSLCTEYLFKIKDDFKAAIEDGVAGLTICGGYQFLGSHYETAKGEKIKTLEIFDFYTKAFSSKPKKRLTGDLHVYSERFGKMVGFENHSGQTFHNYETLGKVVKGFGNNKKDKEEGFLYNNLIGTYMHGPMLSKNPRVADWLLSQSLDRKYGEANLEPLDDEFMKKANKIIWSRCIS